jgi:hypothetical protein
MPTLDLAEITQLCALSLSRPDTTPPFLGLVQARRTVEGWVCPLLRW